MNGVKTKKIDIIVRIIVLILTIVACTVVLLWFVLTPLFPKYVSFWFDIYPEGTYSFGTGRSWKDIIFYPITLIGILFVVGVFHMFDFIIKRIIFRLKK